MSELAALLTVLSLYVVVVAVADLWWQRDFWVFFQPAIQYSATVSVVLLRCLVTVFFILLELIMPVAVVLGLFVLGMK